MDGDDPEFTPVEEALRRIYSGTGRDIDRDISTWKGFENETSDVKEELIQMIRDRLARIAGRQAAVKHYQQNENIDYKLRQKALKKWGDVWNCLEQGSNNFPLINEYCGVLKEKEGIDPVDVYCVIANLSWFLSQDKYLYPGYGRFDHIDDPVLNPSGGKIRNHRPLDKIGLVVRNLWLCAEIGSIKNNSIKQKDFAEAIAQVIELAEIDNRELKKIAHSVEQQITKITQEKNSLKKPKGDLEEESKNADIVSKIKNQLSNRKS